MKFGQYELLEQIAVGGMAEVFKGRVVAAEGFEKLVAIKRILPDLAEDERFVKMLLTEARIHSALSHRNIVQIHDLGVSEQGEYFIVLEYVEGYDLRVIMEQIHGAGEIIPEALSLHIAAEIAQALHFAHELRGPDGQALGLVHRDVTPSNVLISNAGEVKLSDFGLAKRRSDRSVVGSLKGNLAYMSPEQANQAQLDRRTDIFSLGAILFELMTGKRLREITDEVAGWSQVASGNVPSARKLRPDLPAAVEALLDRALAADPAKRFPDAATFGAEIRNVLGDLSVAVGASDLAALLGLITPPRRARTLMVERSKVIRLGPEAEALKEAIAAPATPAPVVTGARGKTVNLADPGPTPPARSFTPPLTPTARPITPGARNITPGRTPVARSLTPARTPARDLTPARTPARNLTPARTPARNLTPARTAATRAPAPARPADARPAPDPMATPLPTTPLPPARSRGQTPLRSPDPELTPRATPPQEHNIDPRKATMPGRATPNRPQPSAQQWPIPGASQTTMRGPAPTPGGRRPSNPMPVVAGHAPQPATGRTTRPSGQRDAVQPGTPAYGVQRPPPKDFALAQTMLPNGSLPGAMNRPNNYVPRQHHETARVQFRPPRQWGGVFTVLVLLLAAAGVGVHLWVMPLDVLIAWRQPTGLSIATEPPGAKIRLDGMPLAASAPTTVTVWRDRTEHTVEATLPGYQVAREKVRYDKSASLSYVVKLLKDPNYVPPEAAAPAASAPKAPPQ
jgi:serine/threonine-protein kinase